MAWNPWAELERRPHITFALRSLPPATGGGIYARWADGSAVVVLDGSQRGVEQTAALAHELIHDERGGGCPCPDSAPAGWGTVARREERRVAAIVAARLVPLDELAHHIARRTEMEEPVTTVGIAEEFGTTEETAQMALTELWRRLRLETGGRTNG